MNLQEKYNEYKQRQEAKKFFNQNNDYHLSISDYIKMFVVGTVIAIFSTIAFWFPHIPSYIINLFDSNQAMKLILQVLLF